MQSAVGDVRMRRSLLVLLGVAGLAVIYALLRRGPGEAAAQSEGEVVVVSKGVIVTNVVASGSIEPERKVNLAFKASGRLGRVYVKEGEVVQEGQLLAELERAELALQVRQAQAALAAAQAQLERATAPPAAEDIRAAQAALDAAVAAYERLLQGPTQEQLTIAQVQLKRAEIALQQAQSNYDQVKWVGGIAALGPSLALQAATLDYEAAKANYELQTRPPEDKDIKALQAQIEQARAQLLRLQRGPTEPERRALEAQVEQAKVALEAAQVQFDNAALRAPFAGVVAQVSAEEGQLVMAGASVLTLIDTSRYHVQLRVDEVDIASLRAGQPATVDIDGFPGVSLRGHVASVGLVPLPEGTGTSLLGGGGVTQYEVRVELDEAVPGLRAGLTAQVTIETNRLEGVLVVPDRAIQVDKASGVTFVERVVDGVPVPVEVVLGLSGDGVTQVLAGVEEGDRLLVRTTSGAQELRSLFAPPGTNEG